MTSKEHEEMDENDDMIVVMTDEDGNEYCYREEMIIPVGDQKYALLVGVQDDEEEGGGCDCGCEEDDEDVFIAKIIVNENGEEEYVDPTDEEFEAVQKAYEEMMDEEENENA